MSIKKQNRIRRRKKGDTSGRRYWIKTFQGAFPFAMARLGMRRIFSNKETP